MINETLVHKLICSQFPQWKDLPIKQVLPGGWDNRTFRLGEQLLVRMPTTSDYATQVEKERTWLPILAPSLPLPIPTPIALGRPEQDYLWNWSVYNWLEGEAASSGKIVDLITFAEDLAHFLIAFHRIEPTGGPPAGFHSFHRGGSLLNYDADARRAITLLDGKINTEKATAIWEVALRSKWQKELVWVHGDISSGNLLVKNGRLSAVIDFGQLCIGDPACDLSITWTLFSGESRKRFQALLDLDQETWDRARAWTLWKALIVAAGFTNPNNAESVKCWEIIHDVISE